MPIVQGYSNLEEKIVVCIFLLIHGFILYLPYLVQQHKVPVGWDTSYYLHNMRIIADKGFYALFELRSNIELYSTAGYLVSVFSGVSFIIVETFLPIVMGCSLTLINYIIIKKLDNSKTSGPLVLILSILNVNVMRLVCDLHRSLLSLILVQFCLFVVLPRYLTVPSKIMGTLSILMLVLAGLSHFETFLIAGLTLFGLFIHALLLRCLERAKLLLFIGIASCLLFLLITSPFILAYLSKHMIFNPERYERSALAPPKVVDYIVYLGGPLIPFYCLGLYVTKRSAHRQSKGIHMSLLLWNSILIVGSFIPLFGISIHSWRFLVPTSVAVMSTISLIKLSNLRVVLILSPANLDKHQSVLEFSKAFLLCLIVIFPLVSHHYLSNITIFRPWISHETYDKLSWIAGLNKARPIFVIYFNYGPYTTGIIVMYKDWINAIVGTDTLVYFGKVESLLLGLPTPSIDERTNLTSYTLWNHISELNISEHDIYLIDEWYPIGDEKLLAEVHEGIYKVMSAAEVTSFLFGALDYYNCTENAYSRIVEKWSPRKLLEVYQNPLDKKISDPLYFQVSYLVPMYGEVKYMLRITWYDHSPGCLPVTIRLDGQEIKTLTYTGTGFRTDTLKIVDVPLPEVTSGFHLISFEIVPDQDRILVMTLDSIEVIPLG